MFGIFMRVIAPNMSECTCLNFAFAPECPHCCEKWRRVDEQKNEVIIKIHAKNLRENKCKCTYLFGMWLYDCRSCNNDFNAQNNQ